MLISLSHNANQPTSTFPLILMPTFVSHIEVGWIMRVVETNMLVVLVIVDC